MPCARTVALRPLKSKVTLDNIVLHLHKLLWTQSRLYPQPYVKLWSWRGRAIVVTWDYYITAVII